MTTPIYDFVKAYAESDSVRGHMPGHKGNNCYNKTAGNQISAVFPYDITEIKGADALFEADGIIAESERNAAKLFGTKATFYSAGGSTLCIQAMLAVCAKQGEKIIAARNSHKALHNACILLGLSPVWIYPEFEDGSVVSGNVTAENVKKQLKENPDAACVYITSPDYLGAVSDVKAIAEAAHSFGKPLIVDNAHGAHLAFLEENIHPIKLGADLCCDSAHKTLPVLTGGAYVHTSSEKYAAKIKEAMSLFGSSSPSYLILQSLDLCNRYLDGDFRSELLQTVKKVEKLKEDIGGAITVVLSEPLKLTIYALPCGMTGRELADRLRESGIEPEYADETHVMLMFSPQNTESDFERVKNALCNMKMPRIRLMPPSFNVLPLQKAMEMREAFFSEAETVDTDDALGRICARTETICPPCVPAAACGEVFDENTIKILKMYSISKVNVVK
ncbi:MAG: aminotransferase class I/II-fold pyridoxal phosphate-dependent enzyme [Oscillospiraceae bacterium]